ncbi:MAG TPA: single-stranded DNA-binding protein [Candidatus Obscuribacterales bacterium]
MSLANVSIVGNLVRAPELMRFASGKVKTTLVVAVNHFRKETKETSESADFYHVEAWGRLAELAVQHLEKGQQITAAGRLTFDRWTDRAGNARAVPVVSANQIAFPRRARATVEGGDEAMRKSSSSFGAVKTLKVADENLEQEVDAEETNEELDDDGEEMQERVKDAFSGSPPVKSQRDAIPA